MLNQPSVSQEHRGQSGRGGGEESWLTEGLVGGEGGEGKKVAEFRGVNDELLFIK